MTISMSGILKSSSLTHGLVLVGLNDRKNPILASKFRPPSPTIPPSCPASARGRARRGGYIQELPKCNHVNSDNKHLLYVCPIRLLITRIEPSKRFYRDIKPFPTKIHRSDSLNSSTSQYYGSPGH